MKFQPGDLVLYNYDLRLPGLPLPAPPTSGMGIVIRTVQIEDIPDIEDLSYAYYGYDFGYGHDRPPYAEVWIFIPGHGMCGFWESELMLLSPIKKDE